MTSKWILMFNLVCQFCDYLVSLPIVWAFVLPGIIYLLDQSLMNLRNKCLLGLADVNNSTNENDARLWKNLLFHLDSASLPLWLCVGTWHPPGATPSDRLLLWNSNYSENNAKSSVQVTEFQFRITNLHVTLLENHYLISVYHAYNLHNREKNISQLTVFFFFNFFQSLNLEHKMKVPFIYWTN